MAERCASNPGPARARRCWLLCREASADCARSRWRAWRKRSGPGGALKGQQTSHRRHSAADSRGRASPTHKNCESQRNALRSPHVQDRRRARVRAVTWITAAAEAPLYGFGVDAVRRPDLAKRNAALGDETAASVIAVQ